MTTYKPAIPQIIALVEHHGSATLRQVSEALGIPPDESRRQIQAYDVEASSPSLMPQQPASVYIVPAHDDGRPSDDDMVEIEGDPARDVLGIQQFDASVYGPLYEAAADLAAREPDNEVLQSACQKLLHSFLGGVQPRHVYRASLVADAEVARRTCTKMRITYSRAWEPGVIDRVIEPYKVVSTPRGYEIDAGPLKDGRPRTYLASGIRTWEVLAESFEVPDGIEQLIEQDRTPTPVSGYVSQQALWAVRKWAESYEVGRSDSDGMEFTAHLLPPVPQRAARMKLDGGEELSLDADELNEAAIELARSLLRHHRLE